MSHLASGGSGASGGAEMNTVLGQAAAWGLGWSGLICADAVLSGLQPFFRSAPQSGLQLLD